MKRPPPRCSKTGKARYRDRIGALYTLSQVSRDRPKVEQRVYRCPFCGGWHLTSRV